MSALQSTMLLAPCLALLLGCRGADDGKPCDGDDRVAVSWITGEWWGGISSRDMCLDNTGEVVHTYGIWEDSRTNTGNLTRAGLEESHELALALRDATPVEEVCESAPDGGCTSVELELEGTIRRWTFHYEELPAELTEIHDFAYDLMEGLETCTSSVHLEVSPDCVPGVPDTSAD